MDKIMDLRTYWEKEYENTDTQFDISHPDRWIEELERKGKIYGRILDSGCGPGRTAIYLAQKGYEVVGIDISQKAIERAREKAMKRKVSAEFQQADCTTFSGYESYFDTIIDIGCFHSLPREIDQFNYAGALWNVAKAGGILYLRAFSDRNLQNERHPKGVPAVRKEEILKAFSQINGWYIEKIQEKEIDLLVAGNERKRGYCWLAQVRKG